MFSNQKASDSSKVSHDFIGNIIEILNKNIDLKSEEKIIENYTFIVRKGAHFTIYLILGILVINLLKEFNIKKLIIISIIFCSLYAISDEIHQTFINGRSGEIRDVIIDTLGSTTGILLYYSILKKSKKERKTVIS